MIAWEETTKSVRRNLGANAAADHGAGTPLRIKQSLAYMAAHLDRPLQVATLAALVNISPSHFFALFKRLTGCAPMDYFTRLRMGRAGDLLATTSMSVKEVAAVLGYDDQFYFSRVFKSINGVSPREYRVRQADLKTAPERVSWKGIESPAFGARPYFSLNRNPTNQPASTQQ